MTNTQQLRSQFYLRIDGSDAPEELIGNMLEVTIESSLHLPDVATITFNDPQLHWIDHASLEPGKSLQVLADTGHGRKLLFDGEIVEIEPEFGTGMQRLHVRAFDRLHRLGRGRYARSFVNVSDGDLIKKLAQEVGLQAKVGATPQVHPYVFQNSETNLDFLHKRAAALGYLMYVEGTTLHCDNTRSKKAPVTLEWGISLVEFRPRMSTLGQINMVTVRGWDPARRQEIIGQARKGNGTPQIGEPRDGGTLARKAFNIDSPHLVADRPIRDQSQATRLAQAVADRHAGRFVEAEGVCLGNPTLVAGVPVQVNGASKRFSGTYLVTSATHSYAPGSGYETRFSVSGLHANTLLNLLAPHDDQPYTPQGLVIGIITDNQDPQGLGRVKVKYPWLSNDHTSDWARVVVLGGGKDRGIQFLPEVNDEVLVGFEMGDIHHPYILGGLWNGKDGPPLANGKAVSNGQVQQRVIRSRSGHKITLDDSDKGGVTIEDKKGNIIKLDSQANTLTIDVKGDAALKSKGNMTIEAQGNLTLKATGQTKVNGMGVTVDGGAATVDVKGTMINLN